MKLSPLGPFFEIYRTIPAPDPVEPASMNLVGHATQRGAETFALLGWGCPERKRSCKIYEIAVEAGFKFTIKLCRILTKYKM